MSGKRWLLVETGPLKGRYLLFGENWAKAAIESGRARPLTLDDWPIKTDPVTYLEKYPTGQHVQLAERLIQSGVV